MDELTQYLHLPEKAVAKQLGICLTSLKKLCRQHGITRWPYRKLKSLDKKIAKAENGTGVGTEDASQLKIAEELKKEKMAVAFTYGLKEKPDGGLEFNTMMGPDGIPIVNMSADGAAPLPKPAPKAKKPKVVLPTPAAASAAAAKAEPGADGQEWPLHLAMGGSPHEIPTPPDESGPSPMSRPNDDEDLFGDVLGRNALDENGMVHPTGEHDEEGHGQWVATDGEPLHV
eukprot:CAMPEP_0173416720 /NCGR_PEP_ID=MMETSP1356-20130122/85535_1 /TAXON_ID=77927 ORGANISM="Hemiselmis virescens, Strain PCC157" /NCGR_SAMPLE_ID=MMETSP1356 /ASSEMBLY_ACC=CAM_ASM_000847 /LENGTH=228 /DNA_ID=CAMNT_0014379035 /DNA_START=694 /DNA_END=1376 /DNA_ORIENTATION=+